MAKARSGLVSLDLDLVGGGVVGLEWLGRRLDVVVALFVGAGVRALESVKRG